MLRNFKDSYFMYSHTKFFFVKLEEYSYEIYKYENKKYFFFIKIRKEKKSKEFNINKLK